MTMRWLVAGLLVVIGGYPLALAPERAVAIVAASAAALCALGVVMRSTPVVTASLALLVAEHALAVSLSDGPPRLGGAVVAGVAVALLLEVADFDRRFRDATLGPRVVSLQLRHWSGFAVAGAAIAVAGLVAAGTLTSIMPVPGPHLLGAAGALVTIGGAALALHRALRVRAP
jgi:hypothetical protein